MTELREPTAENPAPDSGPAGHVGPMRAALRKLTGESLVYGLGQVSGRAVQVLLVPILTRLLTPDVFGVADLVQAYSAFAVLVLVFGMDGALVRYFYREPDREARRRMVSTVLVFRVAVSLLAALALASLAGPLSTGLMGSPSYRKYVLIGAATLPFTLLVLFANDVLRVTFQPWKFIALNLFQTVVTGGLSLWWVMHERMGVAGVLYGKLFGDLLTALAGLVFMRHSFTPRLDREVLGRMLRFGAPLVPASLAYGIVSSADRWFLRRAHGLADVGVYAVALKFLTVVMMGVSAFSLAFFPFAHARAHDPQAGRLYARVLALYVAGASLLALAVGLFAPEVLSVLVAPGYRAAAAPALLLTFAAVAYGAYYVACLGIQLALKTSWLAVSAGAAAVAAVAADALLARPWGATGVAAGTLIGNVVIAVTTYAMSQSVYPLPYRGKRLLALFALAVGLAVLVHRLAPPGPPGLVARFGALVVFGLAVWMLDVWRDRGAVKAAYRSGTR
ncbi:MAG TPA: oligosaccharide flippase family protein [Dongiaceae bacterium]|nr:oligosaccharide flippase family protein [Dongiaceae bacterium]